MTRHLPILIVVIELMLVVATVGLAIVRVRERRRPGVLLDILPPESATADLRSWSRFYRSLFGISHPVLKRLLFGQPSVVFELWSQDGDLGARCWVPARLEPMIGTLVRGALPGARAQRSTAPADQSVGAARAPLRLDPHPVHALPDPPPPALRSCAQ